MEFNGTFVLTFSDYCSSNNLEEAPQEMINKWKDNVISNYLSTVPSTIVIDLFNIPDSQKKAIEYHQYTIDEDESIIDNEKKTLTIKMKLTITK